MQGRAAAVYGVVFLLVAVAAGAYVVTAEAPEPTMQEPRSDDYGEGDQFRITAPDGSERVYRVDGFSTERGQPAVTLIWTDEDARTQEDWEFAEEPGGTTVAYQGQDHYVRSVGGENATSFELLEAPPEDGDVSLLVDEQGNWVVNDGGNYTAVSEYEGLQRVEVSVGDEFEVGEGEDLRTVTVEEITGEVVTVSWNEPAENEVLVRQTDREELNGQNVTAHFPEDGVVQFTTDEEEIDRYIAAHEDRVHFQQRVDGLVATSVLAAVAVFLLLSLALLPRKE